MMTSDNFYIDIRKINHAHEFTLDAKNGCEYLNGRDLYGLVFCIEGEAEYRFCSGERCKVSAGELLLLSPNAAYSIIINGKFRHYTVNFDIHEESSTIPCLQGAFCFLHSDSADKYKQIFKRLTSLRVFERIGAEMLALSCLYELLSTFFLELYTHEHGSVRYERILPAKEYIDSHSNKPLSLDLLARLCNMSITNFRREWTKIYGETPLQYRDRVRLFYAKEYLSSGYYTVGEVACRCGFDDVSYFVRFFKKHTGSTPRNFIQKQF